MIEIIAFAFILISFAIAEWARGWRAKLHRYINKHRRNY